MTLPCRYCGIAVELAPEAIEMLSDANAICKTKHWPAFKQNEIVGCPPPSSCYRRWQKELERRVEAERKLRGEGLVEAVRQRGFDALR